MNIHAIALGSEESDMTAAIFSGGNEDRHGLIKYHLIL
jgi:hypothetical protein